MNIFRLIAVAFLLAFVFNAFRFVMVPVDATYAQWNRIRNAMVICAVGTMIFIILGAFLV